MNYHPLGTFKENICTSLFSQDTTRPFGHSAASSLPSVQSPHFPYIFYLLRVRVMGEVVIIFVLNGSFLVGLLFVKFIHRGKGLR